MEQKERIGLAACGLEHSYEVVAQGLEEPAPTFRPPPGDTPANVTVAPPPKPIAVAPPSLPPAAVQAVQQPAWVSVQPSAQPTPAASLHQIPAASDKLSRINQRLAERQQRYR